MTLLAFLKRERLLLAVLALAILAGLPSLTYPYGKDQGIFGVIADRWLHGGKPYEAAFDVKPPGIFAVYALAQAVFGKSMASIRILDLLAVLTTVVGLVVLGRRWSATGALAAGAAYAVVYFGDFTFNNSAQAEGFAAPLVVWAILAWLKEDWRWALLSGLLLGSAALMKNTVIALALPALILSRPTVRSSAALAAGVVIPIAAAVAYIGKANIAELVAYQSSYGARPFDGALHRFWEQMSLTPAGHFGEILLLLVAVLVAALQGRRVAFEYAWLAIALLTVIVQGRYYPYHFVVVLPPLALIFGRAVAIAPSRWSYAAGAALLGVFAFGIPRFVQLAVRWTGRTPTDTYLQNFIDGGYSAAITVRTASWIRDHTGPADQILVYSFDPGLYFLSDRLPITRHISIATLWQTSVPHGLRLAWWREIRNDALRFPPKILVFDRATAEREWKVTGTTTEFAGRNYDLQLKNECFLVFAPSTKQPYQREQGKPIEPLDRAPG